MSSSSGTDSTPTSVGPGSSPESGGYGGYGWEALLDLVALRVALVQLEAQGAARQAARTAVVGMVAVLAVGFAWALLLAGGIGALARAAHWPWYWIALTAALLHLGAAGVCAVLLRAAKTPAFPITRNEFQKDREWLKNLKSPWK